TSAICIWAKAVGRWRAIAVARPKSTPSGIGTADAALIAAYSAYPPPTGGGSDPTTRSPIWKPVTSGPTASTTPEGSRPGVIGRASIRKGRQMEREHEVVIVGGGPVGVALAVELGQRGVDCALVERHLAPVQIPKGQSLTNRTLEHFYFWRCVDELRAARVLP